MIEHHFDILIFIIAIKHKIFLKMSHFSTNSKKNIFFDFLNKKYVLIDKILFFNKFMRFIFLSQLVTKDCNFFIFYVA